MTDLRNTFSKDNLEPNRKSESENPLEIRSFELNELVNQSSSIRRDFAYDSENARNFDQSNVNKAKEGVKELLRDALNKAKNQAVQIKDQSRKEGHEAGFEEGFNKGKEEAKKELNPFFETLESLISDLTGFRKNMYDKVEREMIEMVVDLAKRFIQFEFSIRDDAVKQMIQLAVKSVLDRETMVIKINPSDKDYAESFRPELHQLFSGIKNITFEANAGVQRGGCIVETNFGVVDARIEKLDEQMERILNLAPESPVELQAASNTQEEIKEVSNSADKEQIEDETPDSDNSDSENEPPDKKN